MNIKRLGVRVAAVIALAIFGFISTAQAQIQGANSTLNLQFNYGESISATITSGNPVVFPSTGGAAPPVNVTFNYAFAQQRWYTAFLWFNSASALTGSIPANVIPTSSITSSSTMEAGSSTQGLGCNQTAAAGIAANGGNGVIPAAVTGDNVCAPIVDDRKGPGSGSTSTVVTLGLVIPANAVPDNYTGSATLSIAAL